MSKPLRIAVEGNIGVGKSTLLPKLAESLGDNWEFLTERVDEDPEFKALLEEYYKNPNKQIELNRWLNYRRLMEFKSLENDRRNYIFERSFFGGLVFCHANLLRHERPNGNCISFYYDTVDAIRKCNYDVLIYLEASPERCYKSIQMRSRNAEGGIAYDYVQHLHNCYETHLEDSAKAFDVPVIKIPWENFGSETILKEQIIYMLEDVGLDLEKPVKKFLRVV